MPESNNKIAQRSRLDILKAKQENHPSLEMPELVGCEYLIEWLFELGVSLHTGMGSTPLTYQEIESWGSYLDLSPWEKHMIKDLSTEYVSYSQKACKSDCPPPFIKEISDEQKQEVADGLMNALRNINKNKSGARKR